ncbi:MAG: helix-turn-helix transcriptional regulator [Atopobiaceae bacterium]|nr:helix-turn-helix transcriptional regulator [Atopobiaceae bacterium]
MQASPTRSERALRIERICSERRGVQAMIAKKTGIDKGAVSRMVHGKMEPYPGWGRAIADALGWHGDWHGLFEYEEEGEGM